MIGLLLISFVSTAWQDTSQIAFPSQTVQVIVPYAAGGGTDIFARMIQKAVTDEKLLNEPFVILNQPGGSGTIGSRNAKIAKPDGYKILCLHDGIITSKLSGTVPYGPEAFEPIAQTGDIILMVVVAMDSPFHDLESLLQRIVDDPDQIRLGTNVGSPAHFAARKIEQTRPGGSFNFVQSGGGQKRYTLLIGGHIDVGIFSLAEFKTYESSGQIRPLAIMTADRHSALPNVPTTVEQGCPAIATNGLYWWAPKGTASERIDVLALLLEKAMQSTAVQKQLAQLSIEPVFVKGEELQKLISERNEELSKLADETSSDLPNFPLITILVTALLAGAVSIEAALMRFADNRKAADPNKASDQNMDDETSDGRWTTATPNRPWRAVTAFFLLTVYVAILAYHLIPYPIVTTAMVFVVGGLIAEWKRSQLLVLVELAIITGFGTGFLFSHVFSVVLP